MERKMVNISKENYDKLSQIARERKVSFDKAIGLLLQETKERKQITDNVGLMRLKFEDIKRVLDSNANEKDKVRKIEQIINECYVNV
jgi:macrodomain Ter protein organizer (MatP/YcbG family)